MHTEHMNGQITVALINSFCVVLNCAVQKAITCPVQTQDGNGQWKLRFDSIRKPVLPSSRRESIDLSMFLACFFMIVGTVSLLSV